MAIFPATVLDNFFHELLDILTKNLGFLQDWNPTAGLTSCTLLNPLPQDLVTLQPMTVNLQ